MSGALGSIVVDGLLMGKALVVDIDENIHARDAYPFGGFSYRHAHTIQLHEAVSSGIAKVGSSCHPTTVSRPIVPVVVGPVEVHPTGSLAHVGNEGVEVVPSRINGNAAPAIIVERCVVRIEAPGAHPNPDFIGWRPSQAMAMQALFTAAGLCVSGPKVGIASDGRSTAGAAKPKIAMPGARLRFLDHRKQPKYGACGNVVTDSHNRGSR